ncbi:MAG: carbon starvation CstA family protein, partial [Victivallaceae bacterium]
MVVFLLGMAILILGYFTYGRFIERILGPDDRKTPAKTNFDGVDYVVLPHWKNMLIQLLNIAGVGPVIGVILGIKFGVIAFLIIPIGNIIGGAVHDFVAGMMSVRYNGANLTALIRMTTGKLFYYIFSIFMVVLLLLVVAVFINIPAELVAGFFKSGNGFWIAVAVIFVYYIAATLFPVDKIIGSIYPIFGALLLIGSLAIFVVLMFESARAPELLSESAAFKAQMWTSANNHPILPMLFVTIACGILSGFHATQSPIIARTMAHEKQARSSFYGMMVVEGIIGMIWAAGGMAMYNLQPMLMQKNPT